MTSKRERGTRCVYLKSACNFKMYCFFCHFHQQYTEDAICTLAILTFFCKHNENENGLLFDEIILRSFLFLLACVRLCWNSHTSAHSLYQFPYRKRIQRSHSIHTQQVLSNPIITTHLIVGKDSTIPNFTVYANASLLNSLLRRWVRRGNSSLPLKSCFPFPTPTPASFAPTT